MTRSIPIRPIRAFASIAAIAAIAFLAASAAQGAPAPKRAATDVDPVRAELVAEHTGVVPGQPQQVGLLLHHAPHWHTYWINPGDSGLPTTLDWTLPAGYKASGITWPTPQRFAVGGLDNFGYDGDVLLPVAIDVPADAAVGSTAHLAVAARWLVCRDECVPGSATLTVDLPVVKEDAKPDPRWTLQFSNARLADPQATAWKGSVDTSGARVVVRLTGPSLPAADATLDAFAATRKVLDNRTPSFRRDGDALVIETGKSEYFAGNPAELDLVLTRPGVAVAHGWRVRLPMADAGTPP